MQWAKHVLKSVVNLLEKEKAVHMYNYCKNVQTVLYRWWIKLFWSEVRKCLVPSHFQNSYVWLENKLFFTFCDDKPA